MGKRGEACWAGQGGGRGSPLGGAASSSRLGPQGPLLSSAHPLLLTRWLGRAWRRLLASSLLSFALPPPLPHLPSWMHLPHLPPESSLCSPPAVTLVPSLNPGAPPCPHWASLSTLDMSLPWKPPAFPEASCSSQGLLRFLSAGPWLQSRSPRGWRARLGCGRLQRPVVSVGGQGWGVQVMQARLWGEGMW